MTSATATTLRPAGITARFGILKELLLLPVIVLVLIAGAVINPNFLTANNLLNNVLVTAAVLGMVVIAESILIISDAFDLSLESTVALAPSFGAWLVLPVAAGGVGLQLAPIVGMGAAVALGMLIGLINGALVAILRLNAFIVTLAMLILLRGLVLGISGGRTFSGLPPEFLWLGQTLIAGIHIQIWILVISGVLAAIFMRKTPTGRRIYAIGGNENAALAAGVNTVRLRIGLYIMGSAVAAFAGLMLTSRIASVTAAQGDGLIFTVFAAAVIGGINLNGGKGTIVGALTGVVLLALIQNVLVLASVPSFWIDATYGGIILAALLFGEISRRTQAARAAARRAAAAR